MSEVQETRIGQKTEHIEKPQSSSWKTRKVYVLGVAFVAVLLLGTSFGMIFSATTPSIPTVIEPGSMASTANYVIFPDASNYYLKNGTTGAIISSGTNATTVIQTGINLCLDGGALYLMAGMYMLASGLTISHPMIFSGAGFGNGELMLDMNQGDGIGTTLNYTATSGTAILVTPAGSKSIAGIQLRDFKLVGNRLAGGATNGTGIEWRAKNADFINSGEVMGVCVRDFKQYGERLYGATFQISHFNSYFLANAKAQIRLDVNNATTSIPSEIVYVDCIFDSERFTHSGPATADGIQINCNGDSPKLFGGTIQQCINGIIWKTGVGTMTAYGTHFELNSRGVNLSVAYVKANFYGCYFTDNTYAVYCDVGGVNAIFNGCSFGGGTKWIYLTGWSQIYVAGPYLVLDYSAVFYDNTGRYGIIIDDTSRRDYSGITFNSNMVFDCPDAETFALTLTGNVTSSAITHPAPGLRLTLILLQDGTGSHTFAWPTNVKLAGGSITLTTNAWKADIVTLFCTGTDWYEVSRSLNV